MIFDPLFFVQAGLLSDADIEAGGGLPGLSASYKYMKQRLYGAFERRQLTLVPQPVSGAERSGPRSLVLQVSRALSRPPSRAI